MRLLEIGYVLKWHTRRKLLFSFVNSKLFILRLLPNLALICIGLIFDRLTSSFCAKGDLLNIFRLIDICYMEESLFVFFFDSFSISLNCVSMMDMRGKRRRKRTNAQLHDLENKLSDIEKKKYIYVCIYVYMYIEVSSERKEERENEKYQLDNQNQ